MFGRVNNTVVVFVFCKWVNHEGVDEHMNAQMAFAELLSSPVAIEHAEFQPREGVYAIFPCNGLTLPIVQSPVNGLLYLGKSGNLNAREFEMHFSSRGTGFSTLRRSQGAILKAQLELKAIPRSQAKDDSNTENYRFLSGGDGRLSKCMMDNLKIGTIPCQDYADIETALIRIFRPILSLQSWQNPIAPRIRALRKACVEEARISSR